MFSSHIPIRLLVTPVRCICTVALLLLLLVGVIDGATLSVDCGDPPPPPGPCGLTGQPPCNSFAAAAALAAAGDTIQVTSGCACAAGGEGVAITVPLSIHATPG